MTSDELLARLGKLLPPQFEEVIFRVRLPTEYLSATGAPQVTRAVEVIRYLEQEGRLWELTRAVEHVAARRIAASVSAAASSSEAGDHEAEVSATQPSRLVVRTGVRVSLVVAAVAGAAALGLLLLMIDSAATLVRVGLTGHVWYVLLLLLGLFAAISVFALFKSYARYKGKVLGGTLEIGGPVVVMLAVVLLGFDRVPVPAQRFDVTVFVHGAAGRHAMVLRDRGKVALDLGADKRIEAIGDKGEARFASIPADLRGRDVAIGVDDDTYELVQPGLTIRLDQEAIYAAVQPKQLRLSGQVSDEQGRPVGKARAAIAGVAAETDQDGRFEVGLPADLPEGDRRITIVADGFEPWSAQTVPGGAPLSARLTRLPRAQ